MAKIIVYQTPGGVAICRPSYNDGYFQERQMTDREILDFVIAKDVPVDTPYKIIEDSALPSLDRTKRRDWEYSPETGIKLDERKVV